MDVYNDSPSSEVLFSPSVQFLWAVFVSVVIIVLINLLIGLTAGDVKVSACGIYETVITSISHLSHSKFKMVVLSVSAFASVRTTGQLV